MRNTGNDLTQGNVVRQLITFALPFMISNIVQSLYNVADMLIVGRFGGAVGISAVNIGGQVTFLITNIVIGLSVGGTVVIGQYMGSRDRKAAVESISTMMISLLAAAVFITVAMLILATPILHLIQTPPEAFAQAREYLQITVLGSVFIFGYNALSAIMRGLGDSKRPLYFVTIACVVNIGLDLILVGYFGMGARGAAIATIISQAASMGLCILYLQNTDFMFDFRLKSFKFHADKFKMLMKVGIPTSIQNVAINISFLVMTGLVNGFGVKASAALGVISKYNSFAILPAIAVGSSVSAMVAQNIGAGQIKRAQHTMYIGIALSFAISIPIFLITRMFPAQIIAIFDNDPEMIKAGVTYLNTLSLDYAIVPFIFCINGLITGAGHTMFASITGIMSALLLRVPAAYIFGINMDLGLMGIGLAAPVASIGATIFATAYYLSGRWKKSTVIQKVQ
ncbi:MATE family efflux transporter [Proteocatella sphenisci]|uniref:MATE family efflux transporter n=1 Tax=Proteocatella sphenisci TaxID=181070 RepID=UPI000491266A|nr:MATE family efflux transporter [Proteocatella sphenisci]